MTTYDDKPWLKFYEKGLPPELEIPDKTYADLLEEAMDVNPDGPAMHFLGVTISFRELEELSARFGAFLLANGCRPGDVVGINLPNLPQYIIALTGALRAGCAVTGISPLLTPKEMAYQINDSGAKLSGDPGCHFRTPCSANPRSGSRPAMYRTDQYRRLAALAQTLSG